MSEKSFYAERNNARRERTEARRIGRKNKALTVRAFTVATPKGQN